MVDFKKLKEAKAQPTPTDPIEIFRRLPKPPGINDLYTSQAQVLEEWYKRRDEHDVIIKLHTGGGKTLVGLLIAQAVMNETREPVIYLAPTVQLVQQTLDKAVEYSIPAVPYEKGTDFPDEFLTGRSVLICTYQALFNGQSRFGVRGGSKETIRAGAIILDDAHVSFSAVRDSFTYRVERDKDTSSYEYLSNLFRKDFDDLGKLGTFDDIVGNVDFSILEIPYWSWKERSPQVRDYLRKRDNDAARLTWPLIRDALDHCHAFLSKSAFVITPILPLVDMIPTFSECQRRVFMSATISDDSALVRTFDADPDSVRRPITSKSLAGVSERMILAPELMPLDDAGGIARRLTAHMATKLGVGSVVLVPSATAAKPWEDVAEYADTPQRVSQAVGDLVAGRSQGPFVFANRYDGIDLPGEACRFLVVSGLPRGMSEYDLFRASTLSGGAAINSIQAQRIEQGMGRAARGAGDFCVVIVTGKDLVGWLSRSSNLKFLTAGTRAQVEIGVEVSRSVGGAKELLDTVTRCLNRDKDWIEYHADTLATLTETDEPDATQLEAASVERKAFKLSRDGYFDKALAKVDKFCNPVDEKTVHKPDRITVSWMKQLAARIAHYWGQEPLALQLQQGAYALNGNLLRPRVAKPYQPLTAPGPQAEAIVGEILQYRLRRGYLAYFDELASHLVPEASPTQFEQALNELGGVLGFRSERPDKEGDVGPDVLWLMPGNIALVIEAKSHKKQKNAYSKDNHGQLLNAVEWFKKHYTGWKYIGVSLHPTARATRAVVTGDSQALTFDRLNELLVETRALLVQLCESSLPADQLVVLCDKLLSGSRLVPSQVIGRYLQSFISE